MKKIVFCFLAVMLLTLSANSYAASIPNGYEEIRWGTLFHKIMEDYPKGKMTEYNKEMVYTQDNPDQAIASRMFAFKDGLLTSVSVTYDSRYVQKTGIDAMLQKYIKQYGKGKQGPKSSHMSTYVWEGKQTRITFMYVPKRADMTVLQFEKK
ncbi:hypothetical protein GMST_30440 [Geomonas silvestris]|uniref:DUF3887 domain-containing protein n=1 Tax=Geomonas silvestris TaxID=2740184 RepID=A0A6V8MM56_9BACT|nr:hypothetical protein [Geomonas silvestris]GFO60719.1 hypothetical protein GMST_30440 [Geomonas silvestris]